MSKNLNAQRFRHSVIGAVALSLSTTTAPQAISSETKYTYDTLGRVTEACYPNNTKVTYQYDPAGNRTQMAKVAMTGPNCTGSGSGNTAPICSNLAITINGIPTHVAPITITPAPYTITDRCVDSEGHALTILIPSMPHSFTLASGQTVNIPFTVSDGNGGTGGANLSYYRP